MTESPDGSSIKLVDPNTTWCTTPPEQLVYDLVEEWAATTEDQLPEYREAA